MNGNLPLTEQEREDMIRKATAGMEVVLDSLRFNWRDDPNGSNTPYRVAKSFVNDLMSGCYAEPPKITAFDNDEQYDGMVFQGGIPVKSLCSHHLLPFVGVCHVAYLPSIDGKVIGLSKLNRIVEHYSRRPQIQEGLTMQIHNAIDEICVGNRGVAVVVSATHTCACLRGIKHAGAEMKTSKLSGCFYNEGPTRDEFYSFIASLGGKGSVSL